MLFVLHMNVLFSVFIVFIIVVVVVVRHFFFCLVELIVCGKREVSPFFSAALFKKKKTNKIRKRTSK